MMKNDYKVKQSFGLEKQSWYFSIYFTRPLRCVTETFRFWKDENAVQRFSFILLQEFRPQLDKSWMNSAYFALGGAQRLFSR